MTILGYIGVDQYGQTYRMDRHPRKELLEKLGATHTQNMYIDTKDGKIKHVGYVIQNLWINVYPVVEWKVAQ